MTGRLWIVSTPIGNLEDITLRALRVLREADQVLAEDTRRTRILLSHHHIDTPMTALHAHSSDARVEALADELAQGKRFALVSDAGTPLVSDPGAALVRAAIARDVPVEALPGASAVTCALCVAGVRADHFRFVGFLPRAGKRRREALQEIARDRLTSVLFEAPNRLHDTLEALRDACGGERPAAVCRELTKLHEEVARGSLDDLCARYADQTVRGEITVVVEGAPSAPAQATPEDLPDLDALIRERMAAGQGAKEIARELSETHRLDKRELYARVVALRSEQ